MSYRGYGEYGHGGGAGGGVGSSPGSFEGKVGGGRLNGRGAQHQATTHWGRGGAAFSGNGGRGNGRGGRGGGKRSFDHPSEGGDSKKFKHFYSNNFSSYTDQCISVGLSEKGEVATSQVDFSIGVSPLMWGGDRKEYFVRNQFFITFICRKKLTRKCKITAA